MNVLSQMNDQIGDLDAEIQKKEEKERRFDQRIARQKFGF